MNVTTKFIFSPDDLVNEGSENGRDNILEFVSRMQRLVSLTTLKRELTEYLGVLQSQLYEVINDDYKDFISIATKVK